MTLLAVAALVCSTTCLAVLLRIAVLLVQNSQPENHRQRGARRRKDGDTCHLAVFLGSGGHTTEMLQLLEALPAERYSPRTYIVSRGDQFSVSKAREAETRRANDSTNVNQDECKSQARPTNIDVIELPRARRVHQTWLSTPLSVAMTFSSSVRHIALTRKTYGADSRQQRRRLADEDELFADAIIMNGPGTCVPIVAAVWLLRLLGRPSPRLIYVESFARVKTLSLTAKIVRYFVDTFVVQWPEAATKGAQYRGWLV